jgi:phage protein D
MASLPDLTAAYIQPHAAWRVTLDGQDLTAAYAPRLRSLRLSEKLGEEADELEIAVDDSDGLFAPPPQGATITVALGWDRGTPVAVGLVEKGSFTVDEVSWEGPPDTVTITARSADMKGTFRTRKTRTWVGETVGAVIGKLAGDNALTPRCHPDLAGRAVGVAEQHNKSDMQFLRDLGRLHDATATVKGGALIFAPRGAAATATGKPMPAATLTRSACESVSWRRASRDKDQDGAEAQWHDPEAGKRKTVQTGGARKKRLKGIYASEEDARTAARSETSRLQRASATLEASLAWGNPLLTPGTRIAALGFRAHIDAQGWQIASAEHTMDGSGLKTRITMEVAG